jgi:signal transduction histidine kinase
MVFDPTVLDDEARRYESLADEVDGVGEAYTERIARLDWQGERADSFARRRADRQADLADNARQLREVAASIRDLAEGARAALARLREIAAAVRDFFSNLLAAARNAAENMLSAAGNVLEGVGQAVTFQPGDAVREFRQAADNVLAALPIRQDELPDDDGDPEWFRVDGALGGCGANGVNYQARGRPAEAA